MPLVIRVQLSQGPSALQAPAESMRLKKQHGASYPLKLNNGFPLTLNREGLRNIFSVLTALLRSFIKAPRGI